jgi:hypothetical protein
MKRRTYSKEFVHKKIVFRLRIFLVMFTIMLITGIYDASLSYITISKAITSLGSGILLGWVVGSASNVKWYEEPGKVMMKMDIISGLVLFLYLAFTIFKRRIFHEWFKGEELSAVILCLTAGIMAGRFLSIRKQVINVLKKQDKYLKG